MKKLITLAAMFLVSPAVQAQDLNVQNFSPIGGPHGIYSVEFGRTLQHLDPSIGVILNYSSRPLVEALPFGGRSTIVDQQLALHLSGGLGITQWMQFDFSMPLYLVNDGKWQGESFEGVNVGDLSLRPKFSFLNAEDSVIGLGALIDVSIPTGDSNAFIGTGSIGITPKLLFDARLGMLTLAANAGVLLQESRTVQNYEASSQMVFGVGAELAFLEGLVSLGGEVTGKSDFSNVFGREETPLEGLLGAKINVDGGFTIMTAGGAGLTPGVGTPEFRALLGVGWSPKDGDFDKDGIPNSQDGCPRDAEDVDGFQDTDGCPELDNDGDGVADSIDQCPDVPEDMDGFEDTDGCPDLDNDADGIADTDDQCPDEAEDVDGFQDTDGCLDPDNDGDGILDADDLCPNEAEDMDGFKDTDGCPDPDNDNDGILDADDQCPTQPGLAADNGCPPAETKAVREGSSIKILDMVYFETGKAVIKSESFNLLDQVALIIRSNPDIQKVEVGGHTDDVGKDDANLALSQSRAESVVNYLVEKGVSRERLIPVGYGETKPLEAKRTAAARAKNRRVEFNIQE